MAIAIRFELKLLQFDMVNTFINADLKSIVYIRLFLRQRKLGKKSMVFEFKKALYRLCILSFLWQAEFTSILVKIGFKSVLYKPYCYINKGVLLFFYVNNIMIVYCESKE